MQVFYPSLNFFLRQAERRLVKPYFPFIRLLCNELHKLPRYEGPLLFRGLKGDCRRKFRPGQRVVEWSFVSCTTNFAVIFKPDFGSISGSEPATHLYFNCRDFAGATSIQMFSRYPDEEEVLMVPGFTWNVERVLEVNSKLFQIMVRHFLFLPLLLLFSLYY